MIANGFTVDAHELITGAQPGRSGRRPENYVAHHGRVKRESGVPEDGPENDNGEQDVRRGTCQHDQDSLPGWLASKCARQVFGAYFAVALIEHAHVSAKRQCGNDEFRVIGRGPHALVKRLAKTHRESQHLEAELARHPEMSVLVHRDQQAHGDDEPEGAPADFHRGSLGVHGAGPDKGGSTVARFGVGRQHVVEIADCAARGGCHH